MIEIISSSEVGNWCSLKWGVFENRNLGKKFIGLMMDFPNVSPSVAEVLEEEQLLRGNRLSQLSRAS